MIAALSIFDKEQNPAYRLAAFFTADFTDYYYWFQEFYRDPT